MKFRGLALGAAIGGTALLAVLAQPAGAVTVNYANQGDLKSLDPYTLNETTTIAHHAHVYEGLIRRDQNLKVQPALAESWELVEPNRWRFHLRKGVKFSDGTPFTADDVLFSAERVRAPGSNFATRLPPDAKVTKVDDFTVDFTTDKPNPILFNAWDSWYIMSKKWAEEHNSVAPTPAAATTPTYASLHAMGTGPFTIESHQPGVKTVFKKNPNYWRKVDGNIDEIVFTPIANDSTRVSALLSGEVDIVEPVPLQDIDRVKSSGAAQVLNAPEIRVVFLGMDQARDELVNSNVKGKNPFKDRRVREAFFKAIDVDVIKSRVMRNLSSPTPLMVARELFDLSGEFTREKSDPAAAKKLLVEAGYPNGFEVGINCPSDRYVNDGDICRAIISMLARIGVKVNPIIEPKAQYFAKILKSGGYNTSFYMLGWTASTMDSHNVLYEIMGCRNDPKSSRGDTNVGGYCNPKLDELADKVQVETDRAKRDQMIKQAFQLCIDDYCYIPLHQQPLSWGVSKKLKIQQRADNQVRFEWAVKE